MHKVITVIAALLLSAASATLTLPAVAQTHEHHHGAMGPNGGMMQDVAGVHVELVAANQTLTAYLYDEAGRPVSAAGYTGSTVVGVGQARQVVPLKPSDGNTLSGIIPAALVPGTRILLHFETPEGKAGQARF
jgi:hypothetical protein